MGILLATDMAATVSGYKPPDKNIPYDVSTKSQVHFLRRFPYLLKDVFIGLPYYILNFGAFTA